MPLKLIVLDRDGVINQDSAEFVKSADEWQPLPGSLDAIALLSASGFTVAVASNQSGIGRGLLTGDDIENIHAKMNDAVTGRGGRIDRIVICPHHPDDGCDCRKPRPGLLLQIAEFFGVSIQDVPFIGDSERDLRAAISVGARPILVLTGNGAKTAASMRAAGREIETYDDLLSAARKFAGDETAES